MFRVLFILFTLIPSRAFCDFKILTSSTTAAEIVKAVAGSKMQVQPLLLGSQDPHFAEAKPSLMVLTSRADGFISVGLDLEVGWLPLILSGSRNPKVMAGGSRYLELGSLVEPIEVPSGNVDRSSGDVHPFGNPHFYLDAWKVTQLLPKLAEKLGQWDPDNKAAFQKNAEEFGKQLNEKKFKWESQMKPFEGQPVITYHRTLNYFLQRHRLDLVSTLEPKPGISPSARHLTELVGIIKEKKVKCILIESFFEDSAGKKLQESTGVSHQVVATEVGALPEVKDYIGLLDQVYSKVTRCFTQK